MPHKPVRCLRDIQDAAAFVLESIAGRSSRDYEVDRMLRQAIERNFEIIGEAMNRLRHVDPELASRISHHAQIVAFRNVLSHGYDLIDHDTVWRVIQDDLPILKTQVEALLRQQPPE